MAANQSGPTVDPALVPSRPVRFAAVVSHPIQHFAPMFRDLATIPHLAVKVLYCCDWGTAAYRDPGFGKEIEWDVPLLAGYESEFLRIARRPTALSFAQIDNPDVGLRLQEFRPDVVWVHGYSHRTQWRVRRWCIRNRVKMVLFGDSELLHERPLTSRLAKRLMLPWFYRPVSGFITIGDHNEAYYRHYGVPQERLFRGAFPVDIARFRRAVQGQTAQQRSAERARFGLAADAIVALFVGKFIGIKRPLDLVDALGRLQGTQPPVQALLIGSGELESAITTRIRELGLVERVRLAGFVNQAEMPRVLHAGDVLVMPSAVDPHPLVVTESMAVGNAIVASDRVGCVGPTDAARPGVNALVYPCGDVGALAEAIRTLAQDSALRQLMAEASIDLAWSQDTSACVRGVLQAIRALGLGART